MDVLLSPAASLLGAPYGAKNLTISLQSGSHACVVQLVQRLGTPPGYLETLSDHLGTFPGHLGTHLDHLGTLPNHLWTLPDHLETQPDQDEMTGLDRLMIYSS